MPDARARGVLTYVCAGERVRGAFDDACVDIRLMPFDAAASRFKHDELDHISGRLFAIRLAMPARAQPTN